MGGACGGMGGHKEQLIFLKTSFRHGFNYKSSKSNLFILRSNSVYCRKMEIIIIIKLQKTNWSGDYDEKGTNVEGNKKG